MKPVVTIIVAVAALAAVAASHASWSTGGSGQSAAKAHLMPAGQTPAGTASGSNVTVTWPASTFTGGGAVSGYVVRRYNSVTGAEAATLAGCAGTVNALTCTENGVPTGTWRYSVTPAAGTWRGAESALSAVVTVVL